MPKTREEVKALRKQLVWLLREGHAHAGFDSAIRGLPAKARGAKVKGAPYTAWELLEHMRLAQWDILEFSRDPKHVSPDFPSGYWPRTRAPAKGAWEKSVRQFRADLKAMERLVANPQSDLFARIPHGDGQTLLREALLLADHNAYHLGQLVMLRRLLGEWGR
jgi:hypothetical protein